MLQHAKKTILYRDHRARDMLRYVNCISGTSSYVWRISLPDLTHLDFRNHSSAGLAKWKQTKKNKKQIIRLWLELSKNSQDLPSTSWLRNKMKCSDSEQHYIWWGTSKKKCCLLLVRVPPVWRMAAVSCPVFAWSEIVMGDLKIFSSRFLQIVTKIHKQRRTQKCEKTVKNSWKGGEKHANFHMWINLVLAFWSGIPHFYLWMCNQIDTYVVHLSLLRASVDSDSCSFLFSQRFNFFAAPNWSRNSNC